MLGSVDSTSFVLSFPKLRPEDVANLGFLKKRDRFGSWTYFDNGMREINEPQITLYQNWQKVFRLRVDANIAKLLRGSNIELPSYDEIHDGLLLISNNVQERTGFEYDVFKADMCRIDYAFNFTYPGSNAKRVIDYYANYHIPRMSRTVNNDETVYFENKSRAIRIYDKNAETIKKNPQPELIELSAGMVRFEYYLNGLTPVKRFAERIGFHGSSAQEMLSEGSINTAVAELKILLGFDNLDFSESSQLEKIFRKTKDLKKAIQLSGYLDALKSFGKDFHLNPAYSVSEPTYRRNLCELQKLGLLL